MDTQRYQADDSTYQTTYGAFHKGTSEQEAGTARAAAGAGQPTGLTAYHAAGSRALFGAAFRPKDTTTPETAPRHHFLGYQGAILSSAPAQASSDNFMGASTYKPFTTEKREAYTAPEDQVELLSTLTAKHGTFGASTTEERASENIRQRNLLRPTLN